MKQNVFICGAGPLPSEKGIVWQTAYGLRTWQLLHAFDEIQKWNIRLVLFTESKHYEKAPLMNEWETLPFLNGELHILRLDKDEKGFQKRLKAAFTASKASLCLGINNFPSYCLAKLNPKVPFWADLNGWLMGEAQSAAYVHKDSSYLPTLLKRELLILSKMDKASTASSPQKEATYGELATIHRLNHLTESWDFLHVIPPNNLLPKENHSNYRLPLPENSKAILFCGSYNTWLDEETLFKGVEGALRENSKLHFVSTGSLEDQQSNPVLKSFLNRIEASDQKNRFHFLGHLKKEDLLSAYKQVEAAVNVDRDNLESHFGARNRINEWLRYGVPIVSTSVSEITRDLENEGLLLSFEPGDHKKLSLLLSEGLSKLDKKEWQKKAELFETQTLSYEKTLHDLKAWLKKPQSAPDKNQKIHLNFLAKIRFRVKKDGLFFLLKWAFKKLK